jgi:hypothetical protein
VGLLYGCSYVGALCSSGFFWVLLGALCYTPGVIELCFKLALFDKYNITYKKKVILSHFTYQKKKKK